MLLLRVSIQRNVLMFSIIINQSIRTVGSLRMGFQLLDTIAVTGEARGEIQREKLSRKCQIK
jgi:hypothetical protein